jgi:superfamily II DNA/RNA helicase
MRKDGTFGKNHLPKFLVVLPTRELAIQVKDEIESLKYRDGNDFRVIAVYGKSDIRTQMETIKRGIDIIVGTPGRLIDLLEKDVVKMN